MRILLFAFTFSMLFFVNAQADLNQYKYIIVPKKFEGFRNANQYQTSTLIKYLFTEKGFTPIYEDALPEDLNKNRCLGVTAGIDDSSGMFTTKLVITLKDCQSKVVFETKEGISKDKDYKAAYNEAINDAFISFNGLNYVYKPSADEKEVVKVSFRNDVKQVAAVDRETPRKEVLVQEATTEQQTYKELVPEPSDLEKGTAKTIVPKTDISTKGILYAQEIANGFQLVDSTPKIVLRMIKSTMEEMYFAKAADQDGVVYKKGENWYFEYTENDKVIVEELQIKF